MLKLLCIEENNALRDNKFIYDEQFVSELPTHTYIKNDSLQ